MSGPDHESLTRTIPRNIAISIFIFALISILAAIGIVFNRYKILEETDIEGRREIFLVLMSRERSAFEALTKSYAEWIDTYEYVVSPNDTFIEDAFGGTWLETLEVDIALILSAKGELLWSNEEIPDPEQTFGKPATGERDPLLFPAGFGTLPPAPVSGFVLFKGQHAVYVSWPITDDAASLPPNGVLVFIRLLTSDLISSFTPGTDFRASIIPASLTRSGLGQKIQPETAFSGNVLVTYDPIQNPAGDLIGYWRYEKLRRWRKEAIFITSIFSLVTLLATAGAYFVTYMVVRKQLVLPVLSIGRHLNEFSVSLTVGVPLEIPVRGEIGELAERVNELTKQVELQTKELDRLACTDGLTGLANRRSFDIVIKGIQRKAEADGKTSEKRSEEKRGFIGLGLIDIDFFKNYNDTYGHAEGDEALKRIAAVIRENAMRPGDLPARYGGEEFILVLPETDESGTAAVLERIRSAVEALAIVHSRSQASTVVTISAGAAAIEKTDAALNMETLFKQADRALYAAKAAGRNRVMTASET